MMDSRAASSLLLLLGVLLLTHLSSQQVLSRRKISKKVAVEPQKDEAIKDIQKQIDDIMKEVNLLKEQQALQTVCLKGTKVQGKCYLADPVRKRYHVASEDCIAKGGTLTTPLSLDENDKLQDCEIAVEPQKDEAIKDIQKQIDDIMKEVNLLKEQQALQTVCLKGTKVQGKCYLADPVRKRYHVASEDCIAKGGTLTTPLSLDENDKLQDYARESIGPDEQIWLGINDMLTEGAWVDQTGSAVRYKNWDAGFKGNDATLNCAVLSGSSYGKWLDENCRQERASVCEFNIV